MTNGLVVCAKLAPPSPERNTSNWPPLNSETKTAPRGSTAMFEKLTVPPPSDWAALPASVLGASRTTGIGVPGLYCTALLAPRPVPTASMTSVPPPRVPVTPGEKGNVLAG